MTPHSDSERESQEGSTGPADRDRRIDILRGTALVLFAVAVLAKVSNPDSPAFDSTAAVSATALIVALEGALIGMHHRPRAATLPREIALRLWRRAGGWYVTALIVVVAVSLIARIPGINTAPVTTLEYDSQPFLFGAPPSSATAVAGSNPINVTMVLNVVLLRVGPWPLDVAVLVSALFAIAPLLLLALARGKWATLVSVSIALYLIELVTSVRVLPTRAEANLPVLGWQLVFTLGVISGYYRRDLIQWFRRGSGLALFLLLALAAMVWFALPAVIGAAGHGVPIDLLTTVAGSQNSWLFDPSTPGPLRIVVPAALIAVAYGALSAGGRPLGALLGWLLAPIGSAVLPGLILLVCAAVSTSTFVAADAVFLPSAVIVALIVLVMWTFALVWDSIAQARKRQ